jgi:hypothetical protein
LGPDRRRIRPGLAASLVVLVLALLPAPARGTPVEPPPSRHDPEEVGVLAEEILARDEFATGGDTLLERIADWLGDLFDGGNRGPDAGAGTPGSGGSAPFTVLLLALAAAGIFLAVRALRRRPRPPAAPAPAAVVAVATTRGPDDWVAAAVRHEAAGEWKDGLRCRFRALVDRLTERGVVPEVPGRTSGELREDVRSAAPGVGAPFDTAADLFDRAWYGDLPTGPAEAERFGRAAEQVLAAAGTAGAGAGAGEATG